MTKTLIWTAAFVGVFVLLFIIQLLTSQSEQKHPGNMPGMTEETASPQSDMALFEKHRCTMCHGGDLNGTPNGPALINLAQYYDRSQLINYLQNPSSFMSGERFTAYKAKYRTMMPPFNNVDIKELGKIAELLLNRK